MLLPNIAAAAADKANVCHVTGNGGLKLLSVSVNAVPAHLAHGDVLPGTSTDGEPYTGDQYTGLYGGIVTPIYTPVTTIGSDCTSISGTRTVLRIDKSQNFQQGQPAGGRAGWAGWSCIESGYPKVVGGGVTPETGDVFAQGPAKSGAAAIDGYNYPVYPHYTFPSGEEGWVVEAAGANPPTGIYVLCGQ